MQTQSKPMMINTRQVAVEMLMLAGQAFAVGAAVSVGAALLIVLVVTLAA